MNTEVISKAAYSNGLQENGQDGVVFTMPASRKKFMSVYIRPDIDTLVFSRKFIEYNLMDENKVFPNIKKICIENGVREIKIKNSTFPNVEQVVSESSSFASGEMLIEVGLYNQYTLINTFIKKPTDVLNLADITFIADHALDGCLARIKKIDENISVVSDAFKRYFKWNQPYVDGVKMINSLIIDIDSTAEVITIPSNARNICKDLQRLSNVKEVKVDRLSRLYIIPSWNKINKVCLTSKEYMGFSNLPDIPDIKEIDIEDNPYFKSIDGIIYTKDGESLVLCPSGRTKKVVIADGTKSIETSAFKDSKVKSVICPDSLQNICCTAFNKCSKLQHVDFGKGITILGDMQRPVFHKCDSLKNVEFPPQIKYIGKNMFSRCFNLSKIIFHEGLEKIGPNAFSSCKNVDTVKFPASLTYVGDGNFQQVNHFVFKKDRLPKNFLRAVATFEEFVYGARNIFEIDAPNVKFYMPSYIDNQNIAKADFYMSSYDIDYEYALSLLNVASHYGQKEDIALKMYIHFAKNGIAIPAELSLFLSTSGGSIAKRLANDRNHIDEFGWMLKSKFVNDNDLQWILNGIRDDAVLTAYALDAIKERKTEDFHI
jgi:hypothetical protein